MSRRKKILIYVGAVLASLLVIIPVSGILVLRSQWFHDRVRERIVAEIEKASGGHAEIGSYSLDWRNLTAEVRSFVLHGTEPLSGPPLLRADSIQIGIKIISVRKEKVDIRSLVVNRPEVHIFVAKDGTTNLPAPKIARRAEKDFIGHVLDLAVRKFEIRNGLIDYDTKLVPLDVRGENLQAALTYEAAGPRYRGQLSSRQMHFSSTEIQPLAMDFDTTLIIQKDKIEFSNARLRMKQSSIELAGAIDTLVSPHGTFAVKAQLFLDELARPLRLPLAAQGMVTLDGKAALSASTDYALDGKVTGRGLAYHSRGLNLNNIGVTGDLKLMPDLAALHGLTISALDGIFHGDAEVNAGKHLKIDGDVRNLSLQKLARLGTEHNLPWSGLASGPVHVRGRLGKAGIEGVKAQAKVDILPGSVGAPVRGSVDIAYDQQTNSVQFGNAAIATGASRIQLTGKLGETLKVHIESKNLDDLIPALQLGSAGPVKRLPVTLKNGTAIFDGTVTGSSSNPHIAGQLTLLRFEIEGRDFDRFVSNLDLDKSSINLHTAILEQGELKVEGQGQLGLMNWSPTDGNRLNATLTFRNADIGKLLGETEMRGVASGSLNVEGTYGAPSGAAKIATSKLTIYGEQFTRGRADLRIKGGGVEVVSGVLDLGTARISLNGGYTHRKEDWKTGKLRFDLASKGFTLAELNNVQQYQKGLNGEVDLKATGSGDIVKGDFQLAALTSQVTLKKLSVDGAQYGNLLLTANTKGTVLDVRAEGDLRGSKIAGSGEWRLEGDYPGEGRVKLSQIKLATLNALGPPGKEGRKELPFDGFIEGDATFAGPLKQLDKLKAKVTLTTVQLNTDPRQKPRAGAKTADLVLKNAGPIVFEASRNALTIEKAEFSGTETKLKASGLVSFDQKTPMNLQLNGDINLAILQLFNPDLLASGNSTVRASIRGTLTDPQLNGSLELKNASLYLTDLPNGVEKANGVIRFDRNRATIENLTAQSGGGQLALSGGLGFGGNAVTYRLQAKADRVRYRSEGLSITANALLNLTGTSESSLVSGTVTVVRAGFNPRTDVGGLLAQTARPVSTPSEPSEYLRGMRFDVRIESAPSMEFSTSLSRDIQAEADMRLRGTPERPVVLGRISVNQGEVQAFGNKYTINRGEINLFNPVKIEPILDLDLETKARGVTVNISVSGTINKLNVSYRSDPPLQSNEIIALLAVGRAPQTTSGLAGSQTTSNTSYLATGANTLLGQSISAPVSNRLQRFFGVSHIKIDPQLTGLDQIPQARLTLEQDISKDITLTYTTNLQRTSQQIIRLEWALNRRWSVLAVRDESGVFGIDFQYRKRFK